MKLATILKEGNFVSLNDLGIPDDGEISVELWDNGNSLELSTIVIPKENRKKGIGTDIMNKIINYADVKNKPIYLTPSTSYGATSINRLINFYKRFGFIKNKDKSISKRLLVRYPAKQNIEEEYPSSWNLEEFKKLTSFKARIDYCRQHLGKPHSGSSRLVFIVDNEKVLKLAKNSKGIAQNEVEIDLSDDNYLENILAKVFDSDYNSLWVEMELARKVTPSIFKSVTGFDFNTYIRAVNNVWMDANSKSKLGKYKIDQNIMDAMYEDDFVSGIFNYIGSYDIPKGGGDLQRLSTYGVVKRDGKDAIVIIDYGLTGEVYDSYYS